MVRVGSRRALAVLLMAGALAACDSETPTGPSTPPPTTTTPFSGTVTPNGATTHTFDTAAGGTVTATLVSVSGGEDQVIGFALGNWFASFCSVVLANDQAKQGAVLTGNLTASTQLCLRVYDANGSVTGDPVSYTVEIVHP